MDADVREAGASRIERGLPGAPRVAPLAQEELCDAAWDVILRMRRLTSYPLDAPAEPFFTTFGRHPALFDGFMRLGFAIMAETAIPPREKELVILRTGWLCNAPFQWGEHVAKGRISGLGDDEIERVKEGSAAKGWSAKDRALLSAVEELHADAMIADATWAALTQWLDERQLIELPVLVGQYHMTAFLQNSLRLAPTRDQHGEPARQE